METTQQCRLNKVLVSSVLLGSLLASSTVLALCNAHITLTKPDALYQDNLDGTVTDIETGLMWQKCSQGQSWNAGSDASAPLDDSCDNSASELSWGPAMNTAQTANANTALGYDDWYLPNKNELASLLEDGCDLPSINSSLFPPPARSYWSSSLTSYPTNTAYNVNFHYGFAGTASKTNGKSVRLVRVSQ